jgi:hypothetical protein
MKPKQIPNHLFFLLSSFNFNLFLFIRESINTTIKATPRTNNINGKREGIQLPIPTKNKVTITTINVSKNSFNSNGLPNSSFSISPHIFSITNFWEVINI